jgi:hypothetical protein
MKPSSENCKAQGKVASDAHGKHARTGGLTPGEHALLALIGEIVAERLWAAATGGASTAGEPAEEVEPQTDG